MKIYRENLDKKIASFLFGKDGLIIEGFLNYNEKDSYAYFIQDDILYFKCTRPIVLSQTHLFINVFVSIEIANKWIPTTIKLFF